jgi:hypothetical protein
MGDTKIAIGYVDEDDAFVSGKKLAESVMSEGVVERPDLALAFCTGRLDHDQFLKGLQSTIGTEIPVVGGSSIGVMTNDHLSYEGFPAVLALIQSDSIDFRVAAAGDLDKGEQAAGRMLAQALPDDPQAKMLLAFYDSVRVPATDTAPPVLNASMPLLAGIEKGLRSNIPILGAGLVGDYGFGPTKQFCGSCADSQSVVSVLFSGSFQPYYRIMHGCRPLDGIYHTITKIEGSILFELDGKPVVKIIDDLFANDAWRMERPVDYLTIGVNYGKRYGEPEEDKYVNRLITGITPDGQGVGLFEPDLEQGMEIQFMLRDTERMLTSAKENSVDLVRRIENDRRRSLFGLYIDCAGRTAAHSNTPYEEASEVQKVFKKHGIPLLGFYSGVEICPLMEKSRGLDWTGVLIVFAEDA